MLESKLSKLTGVSFILRTESRMETEKAIAVKLKTQSIIAEVQSSGRFRRRVVTSENRKEPRMQ